MSDTEPRDERHEQANTLDWHAQCIVLVEYKHNRVVIPRSVESVVGIDEEFDWTT